MKLRAATPSDLELLRRWDTQAHVVASDPNDDWNWAFELNRSPSWREQLIAESEGIPVGFVQIIDPLLEETAYWGKVAPNLRAIDIWIGEAENLNRGYGSAIMQMALDRCFANPEVTAVLVDPLASNEAAHRFYRRFGFRFLERRMFGRDDCYVFRVDRKRYEESETLNPSRSPSST